MRNIHKCLALCLALLLGWAISVEGSPDQEAVVGAKILNVSGSDEEGGFLLTIETDLPAGDCKFYPSKDRRKVNVYLDGIVMEGKLASVPIRSSYMKRIILKPHKEGTMVSGDVLAPWGGYTVNKEGNKIYVRLYPNNKLASLPSQTEVKNMESTSVKEESVTPKEKSPKMSKPEKVYIDRKSPELVPVVKSDLIAKPIPSSSPAEPKQVLDMSSESITNTPKIYTGKPISLDLVDADIKNVIRLIADLTGMNIVVDPGVSGKITIKVEQVPWDQVLDMILKVNNLGIEQTGGVFRIATKAKLSQELEDQEKFFKARKNLIEEQMNLEKSKKNVGVLETHYLTVNYADLGSLKSQIESSIKSPDGKVEVDDRTRTIIYTDYSPRIEDAKRLISMLDKPNLQVLLEARIVTVSSRFRKALGITWGFNYQNIGTTTFNPDYPQNKATSYTPGFTINTPVSTTASLLDFGWNFLKGRDLFSIDMQLQAGEESGTGKIIASPKVHTLNNQEAVITQGIEIPYLELTSDGTATTKFREAVLELKVTPTITPDRRILLLMNVRQEEPDFSRLVQGQPPINKNSVTTKLLVEDGSVLVLGGVLKDSLSVSKTATPGLHKIPMLGNLFKSNDTQIQKDELLIFIRPKIIELPQVKLSSK